MLTFFGLILALVVAAVAWRRGGGDGGFYDGEVYGMTPAVHRRYAAVSIGFAAAFAILLGLRATAPTLVLLAAYVLIALLYLTSFLRGASDE